MPLFSYGLGYRMCVGFLLANRELYLVFMRLLNAYEIQSASGIDTHPVRGVSDATTLTSMPKRYTVRFVPRDKTALEKTLKESQSSNDG